MFSRKVLVVSTLAFVLLINAASASNAPRQQERVIAGSPTDSMEVRHLILKGSNEEIGRALAEIAKERYHVKLQPSADPVRNRALRLYIEKNYPILYERMRGVAAAFGRRLDDDAWDYSGLGYTELHAACSIAYIPPSMTSAGRGVVSRDYDYSTGSISFGYLAPGMLHPTARPYLLELHPDHGYASLAMVAYDLLSGVLDGMNSEGLTVTMAMDDELFTQYQVEPTLGPSAGLGELQTLRMLLDNCATVDEAKQALLQTKQYYGYVPVHYLIADRFGNAFVWEYSFAHNREFIIENPGRPLVMTNFSLNRHLDQDRPPSADEARSVCRRYALLTEQLGSSKDKLSEDVINQTHAKVDAQLPQSADKSRPPIRTFWHALYYPEERRMKVSFFLRDEPIPGEPEKVRVVRSDYLEFQLTPTNTGKASPPVAVVQPRPSAAVVPAKAVDSASATVAELEKGGATVKRDGNRVTTVDLSKVDELGRLLPMLHELPDLSELIIQNKKMDDAGMLQLAGLPKLARINLYSSSIGDDGLKGLKTLPSLRFLFIGATHITDAGLAYLEDLSALDSLGLRGDNITDAGMVHLEKLTSLTNLNLAETKVTDDGLAHLERLTRLEILFLTGDNVSDAGMAHLQSLTSITGLMLSGTKVSDEGLKNLKGMRRLTKLYLNKTLVTDAGIAEAKKSLPFWIKIEKDQP